MATLKIGFIPIEGGHYYTEALEEVVRGEELGFDSICTGPIWRSAARDSWSSSPS